MRGRREWLPWRVAGLYAGLSLLYIVLSDWVVESGMSADWRPSFNTYKGFIFVLVTAAIIALLIRRELCRYDRMERAFVKAQRMEAVGQLTGGLAHDFNNLLTVILGNLELIQDTVKPGSPTATRVENAMLATERGSDLTRRLLAFSRRQILEPKLVDVNARLRDMEPLLNTSLGESIEIQFHPADDLPPIRVDPGELESAILNLTINARDAMSEGGVISLTTSAVHLQHDYAEGAWQIPAGSYVMIAVNDQGEGMPETVQSRLFEPFFTTKPDGKGSGLGLPMVHGFVRQSNGHIIVYSTVGHGTTVKLYFPSAHKSPADAPAAQSKPQPSTGHETILLVENDRGVRDVMQAFLTPLGYQVLTAERVGEALGILGQHQDVNLLMTDIILGGRRTGIELAQEARKTHPDIAILLVSGYADPTITGQLAGLARIGWLAKPFGQDALAERVRAVLDS